MKRVRKIAGYSIYILIILLITLIVKGLVFQRTVVSGKSMYPALDDGDSLLVEKLSYRFGDPERYDIIVFPFSINDRVYYVKRIIGMPGETIEIREGVVLIDGHVLPSKYNRDLIEDPGLASGGITLGEHEYFCLGDNVNESLDSRNYNIGTIHRDQIIGKVFLRIKPLKDFGPVK